MTDRPPVDARSEINTVAVVRDVTSGRGWAFASLAVTSVAGGLMEASFLVTVTRAAIGLTQGEEKISVTADWQVTVEQALALAAVLIVLRLLAALAAGWQAARLTSGVIAVARHRMADAYLESRWEVQQREETGTLQTVLGGYTASIGGVAGAVSALIVSACNLFAMLALTLVVDASGAFILLGSVVVLSFLLGPLRRSVRRRSLDVTTLQTLFSQRVREVSDLGMELHVFDVQDAARERVDELVENHRVQSRRLAFASSMAQPLYVGLAYGALLGSLVVMSLVSASNLNDLGAVMLIMLRSLGYGQGLQTGYMNLARSVPPAHEYYERLAVFDAALRSTDGEAVGQVGAIEAVGVSFAYSEDAPVLHDVSFHVAPAEAIGIVGPSGAGKSTLVQLLLRLRDPSAGVIFADGRDIRTLSKREWSRRVTFVPQQTRIISGTIADNIAFLRSDVSNDDVERAARLAHLHDEIMAMPEGYERRLGSGAAELSGGQMQRLCIARALVERPDVLILDEPTSSLDVKSEDLLRQTFVGLGEHMTIFIIAHRMSTLSACGRIMVLMEGRLHSFDTPDELEKSSEFYRESLVLSGLR